jgi:hypothetical protein
MYTISPLDNINCNNQNKLYTKNQYCVLCDSCYWSATFLKPEILRYIIYVCPICNNDNLSLIPLGKDESYKLKIDSKRGLELEFLRRKVNPM